MTDLAFFRQNGYVNLGRVFTEAELGRFTDLYDRDRSEWGCFWHPISNHGHQTLNCDPLVSSPEIDALIRHPALIGPIETILEGPSWLGEACLRHMVPRDSNPEEIWHRDRPHATDRPYRCGYLQMMLYLSDVHDGTHCFSISPEPCDGPVLDTREQLARRGKVHLHGPAGTVILFNLSVLHAATVRITPHERKTVQIYYGRRNGPVLSECTMIPTRFWRDHPDPEARAFYGMMTRRSSQYAKAFG